MDKKVILLLGFIFFINLINNLYGQDSLKYDSTITKIIKLNEKFKLDFQTCPSCGYDWAISNSYDTTQLKLIDIFFRNKKNNIHKIGGSDVKTWEFQGLVKGTYKLIYIYKRPWLKEIERQTIVTIIVE